MSYYAMTGFDCFGEPYSLEPLTISSFLRLNLSTDFLVYCVALSIVSLCIIFSITESSKFLFSKASLSVCVRTATSSLVFSVQS